MDGLMNRQREGRREGGRGGGVKALDPRSRDLILTALVLCKSLGQALNPHHLCPPSSNGYQVQ